MIYPELTRQAIVLFQLYLLELKLRCSRECASSYSFQLYLLELKLIIIICKCWLCILSIVLAGIEIFDVNLNHYKKSLSIVLAGIEMFLLFNARPRIWRALNCTYWNWNNGGMRNPTLLPFTFNCTCWNWNVKYPCALVDIDNAFNCTCWNWNLLPICAAFPLLLFQLYLLEYISAILRSIAKK